MRLLIHSLGSMKIALTLLVAMIVILGAGTIVESVEGSETAARLGGGGAGAPRRLPAV